MKNIIRRILPATAALLTLAACNKAPAGKTIISVVPIADDSTVVDAKRAALNAGATYDIKVRWDVSNAPTPESQNQLIDKLVQNGVDGILISIIDPEASQETIDRAIAKGVKVASFGSDSPGSQRSFYIGSDNTQAGLLAAETLKQLCTEAGRPTGGIGLFGDNPNTTATQERLAGFIREIPDTAAVLYNDASVTKGQAQITTFLTDNRQLPVNGVVFLSSSCVQDGPQKNALLDSLCSSTGNGASAPAVFFDRTKPLQAFLQSRPYCALIVQDYSGMVTQGVGLLLGVIRGSTPEQSNIYLPVTVVRKY